jgi:hypothetical protein
LESTEQHRYRQDVEGSKFQWLWGGPMAFRDGRSDTSINAKWTNESSRSF